MFQFKGIFILNLKEFFTKRLPKRMRASRENLDSTDSSFKRIGKRSIHRSYDSILRGFRNILL